MRCKITKKRIFPFMSFGKMPIANGFIKKKDFNKEFFLSVYFIFLTVQPQWQKHHVSLAHLQLFQFQLYNNLNQEC